MRRRIKDGFRLLGQSLQVVRQEPGLPSHPRRLGLGEDDLVDVLAAAPGTRPGRFTILEQAALTPEGSRSLVRALWGPL